MYISIIKIQAGKSQTGRIIQSQNSNNHAQSSANSARGCQNVVQFGKRKLPEMETFEIYRIWVPTYSNQLWITRISPFPNWELR